MHNANAVSEAEAAQIRLVLTCSVNVHPIKCSQLLEKRPSGYPLSLASMIGI